MLNFWGFYPIWHFNLVCYDEIFEGDGADRAGVIGLIRQGFASVGLEADQPDRDRVRSDQGFLIGRPIGVRSVRSGTTKFKPSLADFRPIFGRFLAK